jgi:hypothetical protein
LPGLVCSFNDLHFCNVSHVEDYNTSDIAMYSEKYRFFLTTYAALGVSPALTGLLDI